MTINIEDLRICTNCGVAFDKDICGIATDDQSPNHHKGYWETRWIFKCPFCKNEEEDWL